MDQFKRFSVCAAIEYGKLYHNKRRLRLQFYKSDFYGIQIEIAVPLFCLLAILEIVSVIIFIFEIYYSRYF